MSWLSKNYEKATLGVAILLAIMLAYFGWSKFGSVEGDFTANPKGGGNNITAVADADQIPKAVQSLKADRTWTQAVVDDRPVDLFTGIALYVSSSNPEEPIDLDKDKAVHPPIENKWWRKYRLDPGFADSPQRDPDADGFSNLEEYNAGTDPTDAKYHPPLIAKLKYVKDDSLTWSLRPGYGSNGAFPFNYQDSKGRVNRVTPGDAIAPNGLFFKEEPMVNRFKLLGSETVREMNERIKTEVEVTYVRIEDQKPNKDKKIYRFPAPLKPDLGANFLQYDRSAVMTLEALGKAGVEFTVEENTDFALPPDAPQKDYRVKEVTPEAIVVEYPDGSGGRKTVKIPKGGLPSLTD